jgi:cyclophilin family peptidyl-prolyl cis-trans isomerase
LAGKTALPLYEPLESRTLFNVGVSVPLAPVLAHPSQASTDSIDLSTHFTDPNITGTVVQFQTSVNTFNIVLTDQTTPLTVANFLNYVNSGAYNNTIFHRSVVFNTNAGPIPPAEADIIQGGGYDLQNGSLAHITTNAPVDNEVGTEIQGNVRGTIAMAKTSDPNSATSEFFFNIHDNSSILDDPNNSGGFTTFGHILAPDNSVAALDTLGALPTFNLDNSTFSTLPVVGLTEAQVQDPNTSLQTQNLLFINKASVIPGITYTVQSDNPGLVQPTINGSMLSFAYTPGASGLANIKIIANTAQGTGTTTNFAVTVPDTTQPATGPTAVNFTAPNILQDTAGTIIHPLVHDTDSLAGLKPSTFTLLASTQHGSMTVDPTTGDVTYTPTAGYVGPDSFQYTIADANGDVSAPATVTLNVVPPPVQVQIGAKTAAPGGLTYTEPDGTVARLVVTGGSATITFGDFDVQTTTSHGRITATGSGATITDIAVTPIGNQKASISLNAHGGTDGVATLSSIHDTGSLSAINAPNVQLTGDLNVAGLGKLALASTDHSTLTIGGGVPATTLAIPTATDTSVTASSFLRNVRSNQWLNTDGGNYTITTSGIATLVNTGGFANNLNLTGRGLSLKSARIGQLTGGAWTIDGTAFTIVANSVAPAWSLNAASLVRTIRFGGDYSSSIQAGAIGSMTIAGNMTNSVVQTNAPLNQSAPHFDEFAHLKVGGAINNSIIFAAGNVGTITASSMTNSSIYAGVNLAVAQNDAFPASISDLQGPAFLLGVHLVGKNPMFSNSKIAADQIKSLRLGSIAVANGGNPQGVAARSIGSLSGTLNPGGKLVLGRAQLKSAAALSAFLTAKNINLQDFAVHLF